MKILHEICLDRKSNTVQNAKNVNDILAGLGHGPGFYLCPVANEAHGSVSITFCDTRTFGEKIKWGDGVVREITVDNVAAYFVGQGHKLVKIVGNLAFGNSLITIEVYETDEAPNDNHADFRKRPATIPTAKECCDRINAYLTLKGLAV